MGSQIEPTTPELKAAFNASRLWTLGYSFQEALHTPLIRRALVMQVSATAERNAARPVQPQLI
jgi:hypothetical protein